MRERWRGGGMLRRGSSSSQVQATQGMHIVFYAGETGRREIWMKVVD